MLPNVDTAHNKYVNTFRLRGPTMVEALETEQSLQIPKSGDDSSDEESETSILRGATLESVYCTVTNSIRPHPAVRAAASSSPLPQPLPSVVVVVVPAPGLVRCLVRSRDPFLNRLAVVALVIQAALHGVAQHLQRLADLLELLLRTHVDTWHRRCHVGTGRERAGVVKQPCMLHVRAKGRQMRLTSAVLRVASSESECLSGCTINA
eukprot:COSAG06_NODE_1991_length_7895_cov_3.685736_6_plen_207_part_00